MMSHFPNQNTVKEVCEISLPKACAYLRAQVWNIVSGQCLHKLEGPHCHESAVTSLQFTDRFIVTSSDDGTVKLWDLQTGKFLRNLVELPSGGNGESAGWPTESDTADGCLTYVCSDHSQGSWVCCVGSSLWVLLC